MVFTTLCRSAHCLWSYQQQQQSSSQPLIWWATYLLYTIMILQILFKSYSWRLFLNVFNFRKAALCWKLNLWKRVTTYYKHTMSSPSGCTVAANKKFPFRFRGTPVQRLAVDKNGNSTVFAMGARHVVVLQYYQNFANHDVDRWLANSGTKTS